jgi:hypothetical protein
VSPTESRHFDSSSSTAEEKSPQYATDEAMRDAKEAGVYRFEGCAEQKTSPGENAARQAFETEVEMLQESESKRCQESDAKGGLDEWQESPWSQEPLHEAKGGRGGSEEKLTMTHEGRREKGMNKTGVKEGLDVLLKMFPMLDNEVC